MNPEFSDANIKASDRLWQWVGRPDAPRQVGVISLIYGGLHMAVGLLLLLSGAAPRLPDSRFVSWITGWLVLVPVLLTAGAYLWGALPKLPIQSLSARVAFMSRLFGTASIALGLSAMYCIWLNLVLLASLGFWGLLSPVAQFLLLCPAFVVSSLFSYSQVVGHVRAFITEAHVELPLFRWTELVMVVAGYSLVLTPLALRRWLPELITLPQAYSFT